MNKKSLVSRVSYAAVMVAMGMKPSTTAVAQDEELFSLEEIVVSARRTSESLQDVPATVSVMTESALDATGINSVDRIVGLTPGVSIVTNTAEVGDTQINIRGINGARDAENNVALVIDGILKTNTAQITQIHGKLTQAEILKGPQGAYYGRNAAAGAIVLTTAKPGEETTGDIKASYAENSTLAFTGIMSTPLSDNAGMVLYGDYMETDGHFRNTSPVPTANGANVDAQQNLTIGSRILIDASETSEFDIKARYAKFDGSALKFNPVFHLPGFAAALGNPLFDEDVNDHQYDFIGNIKPENTQETFEISAKGTWELDSATLTAWALYSSVDQAWIADSTAASFYRFELQPSCRETATDLFNAGYTLPQPQLLLPGVFTSVYGPFGPTTCDGTQYQVREQEDLSAEIRLASNGGGEFDWSIGAYFMTMDRDTSVSIAEDTGQGPILEAYNAPGTKNPTSLMFADSFKTNVYAAFGSIDYDMSENFNMSAALRYDREERDVSSNVPNAIDPATGAPINPGLPAQGMIPDQSKAYQELQPKISFTYNMSDEWNLFANWGVGFKAGGFNSQGSNATLVNNFNVPLGSGLDITDTYDKETSSSFEVGAKGTLADGKVNLSISAFHTDVTDMQFFEFFTGGFGLLRVVSNIDDVRIQGIEAGMSAQLTPGFKIFGGAAVNDSEIRANGARPGTEGNKSPYTADYTLNLGTEFNREVGNDMELMIRADYRLTGPTWFHTVQENVVRTSFDLFFPTLGFADYKKTQRDAYSIVDLRIQLAKMDSWRVTAFGTNIFNTDVLAEVIPAAEFGGSFTAPGAGRTLGVELGFSF